MINEKPLLEILYPELSATHTSIDEGEVLQISEGCLALLNEGLVLDIEKRQILSSGDVFIQGTTVSCLKQSTFSTYNISSLNDPLIDKLGKKPSLIHLASIYFESGYSKRKILSAFSLIDLEKEESFVSGADKKILEAPDLTPKAFPRSSSQVLSLESFLPMILFFLVGLGSFIVLVSQPLIFTSGGLSVSPKTFWVLLASVCIGTLVAKVIVFFSRSKESTERLSQNFKSIILQMIARPTKGITIGRLISLLMFSRQTLNFRDIMLPSLFFTCLVTVFCLIVYVPDSLYFFIPWLAIVSLLFFVLEYVSRKRYLVVSGNRSKIDNADFGQLHISDFKNWLDAREKHSNTSNIFYSFQNQLSVMSMIAFFSFRYGQSSNLYLEVLLFQIFLLTALQISRRLPILKAVSTEMKQAQMVSSIKTEVLDIDFNKNWNGQSFMVEEVGTEQRSYKDSFFVQSGKTYVFSFPDLEVAEEYFLCFCGIRSIEHFKVSSGATSWASNVEFSTKVAFFSPDLKISFDRIIDNILFNREKPEHFDEIIEMLQINNDLSELGLSLLSKIDSTLFIPFSLRMRILLARLFLDQDRTIWVFSRVEACFSIELWNKIQSYGFKKGKIIFCSGLDKLYFKNTDTIFYFDDSYRLSQGAYSSLVGEFGPQFLKRYNNA